MSAVVVIVVVLAILIIVGPLLNIVAGLASLIIPVLFWMLAGMFAGRLLRGRGYGPVGDVLLGLAGGIFGALVLGLIGLGGIGDIWLVGNLIVGIFGAVLLVWLIRMLGNRDFAR